VKTFDPWTATFDEAKVAQDALGEHVGPGLPLYQWCAVQEVNKLRPAVEAGCGFDVMDAVSRCLRHDLGPPDWLARAFLRRYDAVLNCRAGSWDDAFGRPYPKNAQLAALRRRRIGRLKASNAFTERLRRNPMRAVDKALWEEIGHEIDEGTTRAEELYREALRMGIGQTAAVIRKSQGWPTRPTTLRKVTGIKRRR
jgi:hypothetical protein